MKLSELSDNQLRQVATDYPEWMAVHNPAYMAEHQFQWMLRHYPKPDLLAKLQPYRMTQDAPDWMADNYPLLMIEQRLEWMLINRYQYMQEQHPDLVESFNAAHPSECIRQFAAHSNVNIEFTIDDLTHV